MKGSSEGKFQGTQLLSIVRNADAIIALVNSVTDLKTLKQEMANANIWINQTKPKITIKRSKFPGISIARKKFLKIKEEELVSFLKSLSYFNVEVVLDEPTTLEKVAQVLDDKIVYKKCLVISRAQGIKKELEKISLGKVIELPDLKDEEKVEDLKKSLMELLGKILVYTKKPGQAADYKDPLVLPEGATVHDVAKVLHKEFAEKLRYVKVYGSAKFAGQRVPKKYKLKNEDVIEIYS
jgi:ribosome-interacting GTPase 1